MKVGHDVSSGLDHVFAGCGLTAGGFGGLEKRSHAVPGDHIAHEHR